MSVLSRSLNIFMSFVTCCLNQLTFLRFWFGLTWELHRTLKKIHISSAFFWKQLFSPCSKELMSTVWIHSICVNLCSYVVLSLGLVRNFTLWLISMCTDYRKSVFPNKLRWCFYLAPSQVMKPESIFC